MLDQGGTSQYNLLRKQKDTLLHTVKILICTFEMSIDFKE